MMTQQEADTYIALLKKLKRENDTIVFPTFNDEKRMNVVSADGNEEFTVIINRKGYMYVEGKCTYLGMHQKGILLRLDIGAGDHTNPNGTVIRGDHLHIYREGNDDKEAIPIPPEFVHVDDLCQTLIDFLVYFRTSDAASLGIQMVI